MNEKYLKILDFIKTKEEYDPEWMKSPHKVLDKVAATEKHIVVFTPGFGDFEDCTSKYQSNPINPLYPFEINHCQTLFVEELRGALESMPKIDCFDIVEVKCDVCEGSGEVDFEFDHKLKTYTTSADCPICDGLGQKEVESDKPNGKKEFTEDYCVKIGNSKFFGKIMSYVLFIADTLSATEIELIMQNSDSKPTGLKIGEVEVLIMSIADREEKVEVIQEFVLIPKLN